MFVESEVVTDGAAKNWLMTLPGVLTAITAFVSAVTGLVAVLAPLFFEKDSSADACQSPKVWRELPDGKRECTLQVQEGKSEIAPAALASGVANASGALALDSSRHRLLWHNMVSGELSAWVFDSSGAVSFKVALSWSCDLESGCAKEQSPAGTGDFNADGTADVLWHNKITGELFAWILGAEGKVERKQTIGWKCGTDCIKDWVRVGNGDFDADGDTDILWQNSKTGVLSAWLVNSSGAAAREQKLAWTCAQDCLKDWSAVATGDFNADGVADVMWHNKTTGEISAWLLDAKGEVIRKQLLSWPCDVESGCAGSLKVAGTGDINLDRVDEILWYKSKSGEVFAWLADATGEVDRKVLLSWACDTASGCASDWKAVGKL